MSDSKYIAIPQKGAGNAPLSSSPDWARSLGTSAEQSVGYLRRDDFRLNGGMCNPSHTTIMEDYSIKFFQPILVNDPCTRKGALDAISELLLKPDNEKLLRAHLPVVVRLATETPFDDISAAFQNIIDIVRKTRPSIQIPEPSHGPSYFIPSSLAPPLNTPNNNISTLFQELFLQMGRVSHLNRLLATHPSYFERYYLTFNRIMREPGPLPFPWRNYIAILAASRFNCQYLVCIQEQEYLYNNGDPRWLQTASNAPRKIQNILNVIAHLAHQPWLLTKDDIEPLVKGLDSWSMGELVHAMVIACSTTAVCGFVFGCGITPEIDIPEQQIHVDSSADSVQAADNSTVSADTAKVMELLTNEIDDGKYSSSESEGEDEQERAKKFANAESEAAGPPQETAPDAAVDLSRYKGGITLAHKDFDVRTNRIFRVQDYGWKEHGYELVRHFYSDIADPLDEEFDYTYTMTDNTFHTNVNVNTFPFRRAIWYYVQRVKGMCHDDYDYAQVNKYLNQPIKMFVKKLACTPSTITQNDYSNLGIELRPEEKCHIALLALESHKQASLLYGLHAVMMYMKRRNAN